MTRPVLVLCGTGSDRNDYLDDPAAVYGPFADEEAANGWLFEQHATTPNDFDDEGGSDATECELGYWADRDHSIAFLTTPEESATNAR